MPKLDTTGGIVLVLTGGALLGLSHTLAAFGTEGEEIRKKLKPLDEEVFKAAATWKLPPDLIRAVIWVESRGDPKAQRYESHLDDSSYGLMQILLCTAKEMGFTGQADELFQPAVNIHYGCKYLTKQLRRYDGDMASAIAAYNAGGAYKKKGKFVNQGHVDKFTKAYEALRKYAERPTIKPKGTTVDS